MRKFLIFLLIFGALAAVPAAYLYLTTPDESAGILFPLSDANRALIASVPDSADAFAIIPDAAGVHGDLRANPILRDLVDEWTSSQSLPRPWMIGGGDLVIWRSGKQTRYAMNLDPVRAALVRTYLQTTGSSFLINAASPDPIAADDLSQIQALTATLPPADILVVQRRGARGEFPPIGRPAVTSVQIDAGQVVMTSRALAEEVEERRPGRSVDEPERSPAVPRKSTFPATAMFSASFSEPPRIVSDLNRIFGARVSSLFADGGAITIFEVDSGTFLPSPKGVIVLPAGDRQREALGKIGSVGGLLKSHDTGEELLVAFDETSIDRYMKEAKAPSHWPATNWAIRADPEQLVPVLERAGDSMGLRLAAPRIHRAARDLRRWIGQLRSAEVAEAASTMEGGAEELRVRIATSGR